MTAKSSKANPVRTVQHLSWGRRATADWFAHIGSIVIIPLLLFWVHVNWVTLQHFEGSLTAALDEAITIGPLAFFFRYAPTPKLTVALWYVGWLFLQALLYTLLPGITCHGQRTPGGHVLAYTSNGLLAWVLCHIAYCVLAGAFQLDPACIAKEWEGLLVAANTTAFLVSALLYYKAHVAASYPEDNKFSGSVPFDFAFGVCPPSFDERH